MSDPKQQIPLISSGVAGPLGVLHLPRLWQKASLGAAGKLHAGYPACGNGFDQMVLDGLRIGRDDFLAFIASGKPSYPATEKWILERSGGRLVPAIVAELNRAIASYEHDDATRRAILSECGIAGDKVAQDAITLNNLDDWQAFHTGLAATAKPTRA